MSSATSKTLGCGFWLCLGLAFLSASAVTARRVEMEYVKLLLWTANLAVLCGVAWIITKLVQFARRSATRRAVAAVAANARPPVKVCQVCWKKEPVAYCTIHGVLLCGSCCTEHVDEKHKVSNALVSLTPPVGARG